MQTRGLRAVSLALLAIAFLASSASADIVDLSNEVRLPRRSYDTSWGDFPSDKDLRESGRSNLSLAYDAFEISGQRGDAALLLDFYVTEAILENIEYQAGEQHGARGYWQEAAQSFAAAAQNLRGAGQQVALYKRMLAAANTGNDALAMRAADDLLAADPKTYYFGPAQETRALIFARAGRMGDAVAALRQVTDAPGMNVRDFFSAAYLSAWLTKFIPANSAEGYAAAEKAFRDLLNSLERHSRRELATVPKLKIMMSLAASIRAQGRAEEAKTLFQQILQAAGDLTDKSVLAGVYYGLGDVAFEEALALQKRGKSDPSLEDQVLEELNSAALHYLRVILLYKDHAGQRELFGSYQGAARVFNTLFTITGETDCETARRSYGFYRDAVDIQPDGEARRLLVLEAKELKKRMDQACAEEGGEEEEEE